jgi:hypothetical protein
MNTKKNSPIKQFGGGMGVFGGGNILNTGRSVLDSLDPLKNKNNIANKPLTPFGSYNPINDPMRLGFGQFNGQNFNPSFNNGIPKGVFGAGNQDYGLGGILKDSQYARDQQNKKRQNEVKIATNNKRLVDKGLLPPQPKPASTAPLTQLKSNNMQYNNINNKAFSNVDNIKNVMGETMPNTFTRKVGNSPFKQTNNFTTDPTVDQTIAQNIDDPLMPPTRVNTPTTPPYDINNY